MQWSPVADYLLVSRFLDRSFLPCNTRREIDIIDVAENEALFHIECIDSASWSPDGQYVIFYNSQDLPRYNFNVNIVRLSDGRTQQKVSKLGYASNVESHPPSWSLDGNFLYFDGQENRLIYVEPFGDEIATFTLSHSHLNFIDWQPSGEYALVYSNAYGFFEQEYTRNSSVVTLINLNTHETQILSETSLDGPFESSAGFYPTTTWSPNGRHFFYFQNEQLYTYDVYLGKSTPIVEFIRTYLHPAYIPVRWFSDQELAFIVGNRELRQNALIILDVASNEVKRRIQSEAVTDIYTDSFVFS